MRTATQSVRGRRSTWPISSQARSRRPAAAGVRLYVLMFVVAMGSASGVASAAPDESRVSLGFSVGRAQPRSGAGLDGGSVFVGSAGYNLTQSTALGVELGTASFDPSSRGYEPPLRAVFVAGHIAAGPRYGRWHPYVIGGLGLYRFALNAGPVSHGESKGVDYKLRCECRGWDRHSCGASHRDRCHRSIPSGRRHHGYRALRRIVPDDRGRDYVVAMNSASAASMLVWSLRWALWLGLAPCLLSCGGSSGGPRSSPAWRSDELSVAGDLKSRDCHAAVSSDHSRLSSATPVVRTDAPSGLQLLVRRELHVLHSCGQSDLSDSRRHVCLHAGESERRRE